MGNYNLSTKAQQDIVSIYKYGIKYFGVSQAVNYLQEIEQFLLELSQRTALAKDVYTIANDF